MTRLKPLLEQLKLVPNQLTAARLLLVPIMWALALEGRSQAVGIGLALSFLTDFGDGFVARRLRQTSAFGSKFDSIVDGLIGPSALCWLLLLQPAAIRDHLVLAGLWVAVTYASLIVGLVKFRRFANLHLRSARAACVVQYAFLVDAFAAAPYEPVLLYAAAGAGIVASLESLVLQLRRCTVDEHIRSLAVLGRGEAG
jgi:CDP-diacylglycerol--glycerol-3-phosphate 3-phosphatidyltransferase